MEGSRESMCLRYSTVSNFSISNTWRACKTQMAQPHPRVSDSSGLARICISSKLPGKDQSKVGIKVHSILGTNENIDINKS